MIDLSRSFGLKDREEELEEIIERALRKARSGELRTIAEDVETLADYMKTGFKETIERIESIERRIEKFEERGLKNTLKYYKNTLEYYRSTLRDSKNWLTLYESMVRDLKS